MDDIVIVEEAVELLPEISKLLHSALASDPHLSGLTQAQTKTLAFLYHHGEGTISEISAGLAISMASASEQIDRLVDRGLAERRQDPHDRRRVLVGITEESEAIARHIHDLRRAQVREALRLLPADDHPAFVRSLRALVQALRETPIAASGSVPPLTRTS